MPRSLQIWVENEQSHPGLNGHAFATWLAGKFEDRGQQVLELLGEDRGWRLILARSPFRVFIACGNREGRTNEWGAYVGAELGIIQKLFRTVDPKPEVDRLYRLLGEIMREIPGATKTSTEAPD